MVAGLMALMVCEGVIGPDESGNLLELTILELSEKILPMTGSKSAIKFSPLPTDDPVQCRPDIGLAKTRLVWDPVFRLEESLAATIENSRRRLTGA
jgi:UDP-glucuronate decarboxylase